jgi:transposase
VTVGKWRQAFAVQGIEGLRDAPRSGRPPKYDADVRHQVQTRVCQQREDQSRWTVRTLAAELKLPASTVHAFGRRSRHGFWLTRKSAKVFMPNIYRGLA